MRISDWSSDVCSSDLVDDDEQQVADLVFQPLGRTALVDLGTNLADLFVQLVEHLAHLRPVEAHPRGPLLQLLGAQQSGQGGGHAVEGAGRRSTPAVLARRLGQYGRASCMGRVVHSVCLSVVGVQYKSKTIQ